jgi:hypothetical protein
MSRARLALSAAALAAIGFAWIWLLQRDFFYDARAYWALDYDSLYAGSLVAVSAPTCTRRPSHR